MVQLGIYRRMSPLQRLRIALDLTELSRRLLQKGIRQRHPKHPEGKIKAEVRRLWLREEGLYRRVYDGTEAKGL